MQSYTINSSIKLVLILYPVAIGAIHKRSSVPAKSHARDAGELAMQLIVVMQTAIVRSGLTKGAAQYSPITRFILRISNFNLNTIATWNSLFKIAKSFRIDEHAGLMDWLLPQVH